jgi:L-ascorbate metabolism protein UlaG (beta-lactamase superfamily)
LDITWYGLSCFRITERNRLSVVTDPFGAKIGLPVPKLKAEIVSISHDEAGHNNLEAVKGVQHTLTGPGEYEIGGVFVTAIPLHYIENDTARWNVAFRFEFDDITVLHLGDLAHVPDQSTIEDFGEVTVLLLPIGGGNSLRANQAAEVVGQVEPNFVIPMHYEQPGLTLALDPAEKFLKAMGITHAQQLDTLKVTSGEPNEQTQVVLLNPQVQTG